MTVKIRADATIHYSMFSISESINIEIPSAENMQNEIICKVEQEIEYMLKRRHVGATVFVVMCRVP